jgi:transcriptional regulator with XRE-family HTH domain
MLKLPLHTNSLGRQLKRERKTRKLTQVALTAQVPLSLPTLRLLEQGQGNLTSFWQVLEVLSLEIVGRNLPAGETIGEQIATLRTRKGISQRELVKLVGVSQPTLIALERHSTGRVQTLDRVLTILGAGAYLAPKGSTKAFYAHAGNSSTSQTWETPKDLLEQLYTVFGEFSSDPCSPTRNKRIAPVRAKTYFTAEENGLALPWFGNVFCKPPYGRVLCHWVAKAHEEHRCGNTQAIVMLIPARTDTRFWHDYIGGKAAIFFLKGRLKFGGIEQPAPFPSCLIIWGGSDEVIAALQAALPESWLSR